MTGDGHSVDWALSIASAHDFLAVEEHDVLLLDLTLPDGTGMGLLRSMRAAGGVASVIILSAHDEIATRIEGLSAGADDYLVKPFDLDELSARLFAIERRRNGRVTTVQTFGEVGIDFASRQLTRNGRTVAISAREWDVLERLTRTENATVSKAKIEASIYALGAEVESNAVEVYVSRLRKQLGKNFVRTVRGLGYQVPRDEHSSQ